MPRRSLGALAALLASLTPSPAVAQDAPVLVIEGKGFGHGVGMPQDGAHAMAAAGASAADILNRFYPGTSLARRTATVRVAVHESPGPVVVAFPGGGEVRDAPSGNQSPGFPITVNPGGSVQLAFEGAKYKATPLAGAALTRAVTPAPPPAPAPTPPPPPPPPPPSPAPAPTPTTSPLDPLLQALLPTTVPPSTAPPATTAAPAATVPAAQKDAVSGRSLWAVPRGDSPVALPQVGRSYRGTVLAGAGGGGLAMTNEVDVERYLTGLGEMPASWPAAALQAQAIAARTFAVRAAAAGRTLCDDQQCQVYIGAGNEHPATGAAARATRGQVLTHGGALAETVYSASAGGLSGTAEEGFGPGSPDLPYLRPVAHEVADPQLWATTMPLREAGARFGYRGELRDVRVSRTGPSGRPLEITFDGPEGPMAIDGHRFWAELKLRSTLYTLRTEVAPVPGAEGEALVSLPELPGGVGSPSSPATATTNAATEAPWRAPWIALAAVALALSARGTRRVRRGHLAPVGAGGPPGPLVAGPHPEAGSAPESQAESQVEVGGPGDRPPS
ncbi:MAG: SpoIID/LytB domain-containing protein [Acidimicrobiales bacterium]